jgi:hypothetical protein
MENFFSILAVIVVLASFPAGYWAARSCVKNVGGRVALTLLFGVVFMIVGVIGVVSGCSAVGGKMDFK